MSEVWPVKIMTTLLPETVIVANDGWVGGGGPPPTRWILKYWIPPVFGRVALKTPGLSCVMVAPPTCVYGPTTLVAPTTMKEEVVSVANAVKSIVTVVGVALMPIMFGGGPDVPPPVI